MKAVVGRSDVPDIERSIGRAMDENAVPYARDACLHVHDLIFRVQRDTDRPYAPTHPCERAQVARHVPTSLHRLHELSTQNTTVMRISVGSEVPSLLA